MERKLINILSIIAAVSIIFSSFGIFAGATTVTGVYYVINGGTGDGKSEADPAVSVAAAIAQMQTDGLDTAGRTVTIYVMQRSDWKEAGAGMVSKENPLPHGMTYWGEDGTVPEHQATVIIEGYGETNDYIRLASNPTAGKNLPLILGGDTVFKNVELIGTRKFEQGIELAGHKVTFDSDVTYGFINRDENYVQYWDGNTGNNDTISTSLGMYGSTSTVSEEVNVVFNNKVAPTTNNFASADKKYFYLTNYRNDNFTFEKNVNITFNNSASAPFISFGNESSGATVFNKNLNFYIKSAASVNFVDGTGTVTVNGGLQIIAVSGISLNGAPESFGGVTVSEGAWYLTDTSGVSDLLSFTDEAGVYQVRDGFGAKATDEDGTEYISSDGILTIPAAGKYTIESISEPKCVSYYVKNGGTGDGTSFDSPVATIADAIDKINADGLGAIDVANIYIIQRDDYNTYEGNIESGDSLHITAWSENGGIAAAHSAKIIVQSYNGDSSTCIAYSGKLGQGDLVLSGPTEFENITVVCTNGQNSSMRLGAYDVRFGENVCFKRIEPKTYTGSVAIDDQAALYFQAGTTDSASATGKTASLIFENYIRFVNNANDKRKLNLGLKDTETVFQDDYRIVVDNPQATATMTLSDIYTGSTTFEKDLTVEIKSAATATLFEKNNLTVNGALQVLVNSGVNYTGDIINSEKVTAVGGKWLVKCAETDAISLTETPGTYAVKEGYYALATDTAGNQTVSEDGLLVLAADNEYTVRLLESLYENDGETITAYADVQIDLSEEDALCKENSVFIGWKNSLGEFVNNPVALQAGETLTSDYIVRGADDFVLEETQIRSDDEGDLGLRFVIKQSKEFTADLQVVEYGTLALPTDTAGGRTMYLDEPIVIQWEADAADPYKFTPSVTGATPAKVSGANTLEETEAYLRYTLCITEIEQSKYDVFYTGKGYIKYWSKNGVECVIYTDEATTSLYKEASEALAAGEQKPVYGEICDYVENTIYPEYLDSLENGGIEYLSGYENTTDTDPNHRIFRYKENGLFVNDVTVNTGYSGISEGQLLFYSDIHIPYIDKTDIGMSFTTALSSYRGRQWLRDGSSINKTAAIMKYASTFDTVVMGGDAIDYLTFGSMNIVKNIIASKSVNGNLLMAFGNHEPKEQSQPDIENLEDRYTLEQHYAMLESFWSYNSSYSRFVVKAADGTNSAMVVVLDNQSGNYLEGQADYLRETIDEAKALNLPLLVFQHCPMLSYNSDEAAVPAAASTYANNRYGTDGDPTINFYNGTTLVGGTSDVTEETRDVISIIRSNSSVIKGVFDGHSHANIYTEIIATDESGNELNGDDGNPVIIPQYTVAAAAAGTVMRITVK